MDAETMKLIMQCQRAADGARRAVGELLMGGPILTEERCAVLLREAWALAASAEQLDCRRRGCQGSWRGE